jgi:hypothetical protein
MLLPLAVSFGLFTGAVVLDQAFRWTDPLEGIASGAMQAVLAGIAWLFFGLAPGLLIHGIYRWRGWQRFRTVAIASPGIAALALAIIGLVFSPTTPATRLKRFTGADLPSSAHDIRTHFSGGGFADYSDTYFFRCSSTDTNKLIQALHLGLAEPHDKEMFHRISPDWPDPSTWLGSSIYRGGRDNGAWFYYLLTDSSREQVYLLIGCI